jgi:hypothetical protein
MINTFMDNYEFKYALNKTRTSPAVGPGRTVDRSKWIKGPCPVRHDKYYAWLKHRSQANYRKEPYTLTWDQWETLWTDDLFLRRGKGPDSVCLTQLDRSIGWTIDNVEIIVRKTHYSGTRMIDR